MSGSNCEIRPDPGQVGHQRCTRVAASRRNRGGPELGLERRGPLNPRSQRGGRDYINYRVRFDR